MSAINFPDNPSLNQTYTDKGFTYKWNGTVWISVGISTTRISNIREIDDISSSFNGSTTQFPLKVGGTDVTPVTAQQLIITIGGVIQDPNQDYSLSGANIVFSTAPAAGLTFIGTILGTDLPLNTIADDSVTPAKISTGGPSWATDGTVGITSGINIVGVATVGGNAIIGGVATIAGTTQSTNKDTGSLVLEGGLGLEGNINAGGNITAVGNLSAVDGTFSGDVSIGGTLTKQDVTNVDSVGLITARSGIKVNTGGVDISAGGITAAGIASVSAGAAGTVTIGYGNTTLIVDGGARITGILTVGTSSLTLDGTNNKVNIGTGVTVDATGYRVGGDTFLHATGAALPFLNVSGVTTSTGGFMIGITSGATNITNGPIKTLNFVGVGNTFLVSGTTVDISIAGGGGGGGGNASASFFASGYGGATLRTVE
tara:strand:+ start:425 stop:1708 length:1284 start_codon:yes stop_codon:yes gene_type:complete